MTKLLLAAATLSPLLEHLLRQVNSKELLVEFSHDFSQTLEKVQTGDYRLVIMSDTLGEMNLLEILELMKADRLPTLSLLLTGAIAAPQVRLQYLAAGADELLAQTVSWPEFWLRFNNLLDKERTWLRPARKLADLTHYYQEGLVESSGQQVRLRQKENKILECLTRFQHRVVNKTELMRYVWPNPADCPNMDTIEVYIRRLRMKLGKTGNQIKTYRGFGYRWEQVNLR